MSMKLIKIIQHKEDASGKPTDFDAFIDKYGYHFSEQLAEETSKDMVNTDGTSHTWSCSDVNEALGDRLPNGATIGDAVYLANMAYADFYPNVIKTEGGCLQYALAVLNDIDGYEGIAFRRWLADIEAKHVDVSWDNYI